MVLFKLRILKSFNRQRLHIKSVLKGRALSPWPVGNLAAADLYFGSSPLAKQLGLHEIATLLWIPG